MKRKHFKVPFDLEPYNFNKIVLCQDVDLKESALTECQEVESDSKEEFDINNLVVGYDLCAHANYDCNQCKAICLWRV